MSVIEFNKVLLMNGDFLRPFAISLTRDNEAAKDLYQETMYKALANHEKYNIGTNIKAWLFTIMRNIFINDYRRKAKQKTILDHSPNNFLLNQHRGSIVNQADTSIRIKEIHKEIESLPEIFKTPFLMHYEGYKYHEIADELHEPLGTVKSRIHFARKLLKEKINRH